MSSTVGVPGSVRFVIPELWMPFACPEHPRIEHLGEGAVEWLAQFGFHTEQEEAARLAGFEIGRLIGYTAPDALDLRASVAAWLNLVYHALDDYLGDAGRERRPLASLIGLSQQLNHAVVAPVQAAGSEEPFVAALAHVAARIKQWATREQYIEWAAGVQSYLLHELGEANWREHGQVPSLRDYAVYCIEGRAALPSMLLLPILCDYRVDAADMAELDRLVRLTCLVACLDNDIYSLPKEADQVGHASLPLLIARELNVDLQAALELARDVRDQVMVEFCDEHRRASSAVSDVGRRFADHLAAWILGQLKWALRASRRFAHPDAVLPSGWASGPSNPGVWAVTAAAVFLDAVGPAKACGQGRIPSVSGS